MPREAYFRKLRLLLYYSLAFCTCALGSDQPQQYPGSGQSAAQTANPAINALFACYNANISSGPTTFNDFIDGKPTRSLQLRRIWWSGKSAGFPLTVFTQIDMSRLTVLEQQCRSFPGGVIAAAVWVPLVQAPSGSSNLTHKHQEDLAQATRSVEGLFLKMEALNANASSGAGGVPSSGFAACSLRLLLFSELLDLEALTVLLPINALRNAAMLAADTPLAAMVDVDLSLSMGLARQLMGNKTRAAEVVQRAERDNVLWVMPAWDTNRTLGPHNRNVMVDLITSIPPSEKSTRLKAAWQRVDVFPFAFDRYVPGHNATDFPRWVDAATEYPVAYSRGFEPWVIAARKALPNYDARFRGYYYNKLLNVRFLALGRRANFWVLPEVWLVHRAHEVIVSSNVWYKKRIKEGAELSAVFDKPMFLNGTTYRTVFIERNKGFYLEAMGRIDAGSYLPLSDVASQRCRKELPWWQ